MFSLHFRSYPTLSSQNCPSENTAGKRKYSEMTFHALALHQNECNKLSAAEYHFLVTDKKIIHHLPLQQ